MWRRIVQSLQAILLFSIIHLFFSLSCLQIPQLFTEFLSRLITKPLHWAVLSSLSRSAVSLCVCRVNTTQWDPAWPHQYDMDSWQWFPSCCFPRPHPEKTYSEGDELRVCSDDKCLHWLCWKYLSAFLSHQDVLTTEKTLSFLLSFYNVSEHMKQCCMLLQSQMGFSGMSCDQETKQLIISNEHLDSWLYLIISNKKTWSFVLSGLQNSLSWQICCELIKFCHKVFPERREVNMCRHSFIREDKIRVLEWFVSDD